MRMNSILLLSVLFVQMFSSCNDNENETNIPVVEKEVSYPHRYYIDPENGADWNQTAPNDAAPALKDFEKAVNDCLVWKVSNLIRNSKEEDELSGKIITPFDEST